MPEDAASNHNSDIRRLFDASRTKNIAKGQMVLYQGDEIAEINYIKRGFIKAYIILDSGETRTMFLLSKNDVFPLSFSLATSGSGETIKYFYQAMSDVELSGLSLSELRSRTGTNPRLTSALLSYMALANESVIDLLEATKSKSAVEKVAGVLKYLGAKTGSCQEDGAYVLDLKLSHQEIADLCGLTRETVSMALKSLEKDGSVKTKHNRLILKPE